MIESLPRWVAASVVVYVCAANLWAFLRRDRGALPGFWRVLFPVAQALFMLGPPYAALLSGLMTPAMAAFDLPPWPRVLDTAAPLVAAAAVISGAILWLHRRWMVGVGEAGGALPPAPPRPAPVNLPEAQPEAARRESARYPPGVLPAVRMRAQLSRPWGISFVLFDALCFQAHWAFYRLGAALYLHDVPLGAAAGSLLVLLEWLLDPGWRARLVRPGLAEDQLLLLALMLLSVALAVLLPSFWLLLAVHASLWLIWYTLLQRWYRSAVSATLDSGLQ